MARPGIVVFLSHLLMGTAVAPAFAQQHATAIFTTGLADAHVGSELVTSSPPGLSGKTFFFFHTPRVSPDGSAFGFLSFVTPGDGDEDEVLVIVKSPEAALRVGAALTAGDSISAVVEGTTGFSDASGDVVRSMDTKFGLNDNGCYAVSARGNPSNDDVIAKGCEGDPLAVMAREGEEVPNLGGPTYLSSAREPQLDNNGVVYFGQDTSESPGNRSVFQTTNGADTVRLVQETVTEFGGASGGGTRIFESLDNEFSQSRGGLQVSGDGQQILLRGDLTEDFASDDFAGVLAPTPTIVHQEATVVDPVFAATSVANSPTASYLSGDGRWFLRGTNTDAAHWIVGENGVVAKTGDEIIAGTNEHWTTFFAFHAGADGDFVIGGTSDSTDEPLLVYYPPASPPNVRSGRRASLPIETAIVVARKDDDIDLDGDGQITAQDARIDAFGSDDAVIVKRNVVNDPLAEVIAFIVFQATTCTGTCEGSMSTTGTVIAEYPATMEVECSEDTDCEAQETCEKGTCVPICGNGRFDTGEGCDDGNLTPGDGCDGACSVESCFFCNVVVEPSQCSVNVDDDCSTDDDRCTSLGTCNANADCVGEAPIDCSDLDDGQCLVGQCDPADGQCRPVFNEGAECDDGDDCTLGDVCSDAACNGVPKDCSQFDDADNCTVGVCHHEFTDGDCEPGNVAEGTPCDDGDACTVDDRCDDEIVSECLGLPRDCSQLDSQCARGVCQASNGECIAENVVVSCDDGLPCTLEDVCVNGVCSGLSVCEGECEICTVDGCVRHCGDPVNPGGFSFPGQTVGAPSGARIITAADALHSLQAAVGLVPCPLCVCDVNDDETVTASDALAILRRAVGLPSENFCPMDSPTPSTTTTLASPPTTMPAGPACIDAVPPTCDGTCEQGQCVGIDAVCFCQGL